MNPKSANDEMLLMGQDVFNKTCSASPSTERGGQGRHRSSAGWLRMGACAKPRNRIAHIALYGLTGPINRSKRQGIGNSDHGSMEGH